MKRAEILQSMRAASIIGALATVVLACAADVFAQPAITNLGTLPGGHYSYAHGVNADGSVVVGGSAVNDSSEFNDHAFRWTRAGGMQDLGTLPGSTLPFGGFSYANGVSGDGSVVIGEAAGPTDIITYRGFHWSAAGGMQDLGALPDATESFAYGVSGDGSVVVGWSHPLADIPHAFRWTAGGGMQDLGALPEGGGSVALAVNEDGSVVVGHAVPPGGNFDDVRAFRWTSSQGIQSLGTLPGGLFSEASAVSRDGSVVVGKANPAGFGSFDYHAIRWTSAGGMQDLGALPGGRLSWAYGVSGNGSAVVGDSEGYSGPIVVANLPFLWTSSLGMVDLNTYLPTLGLDLTGWELWRARAISTDGSAIVGIGYFNGDERAWLVTGMPVPEPSTFALWGAGTVALALTAAGRRGRTVWARSLVVDARGIR